MKELRNFKLECRDLFLGLEFMLLESGLMLDRLDLLLLQKHMHLTDLFLLLLVHLSITLLLFLLELH